MDLSRKDASVLQDVIETLIAEVSFRPWLTNMMQETGHEPSDVVSAMKSLADAAGADPLISEEDF